MCAKLCALVILLGLMLGGCTPQSQGPLEEEKDPHFLRGKNLVKAMDPKGAVEAFEKALEANPRSAMAHYELGLLYEQRETDFAAAIYHYNKVIKLKGSAYPADNARQRIAGCKQELVKSESLAPAYQTLLRDLDRLKEENLQQQRKLEAWQAYHASRPLTPTNSTASGAASGPSPVRASSGVVRTNTPVFARGNNPPTNRSSTLLTGGSRAENPLPVRGRTHLVLPGETATAIARRHGIKLSALAAANPGVDPGRLKAGQTLNIPST